MDTKQWLIAERNIRDRSRGESMRFVKTVFHVHTDYSVDSNVTVESLVDSAGRCGVDCIAVTDHNTMEGAVHLARIAPPSLRVIAGEEVSTSEGHLIGLFLREPIQPGLSARATAELIRAQHGLVVAPHPFNRLFGCSLRQAADDIADLIDLVEVCNAQNLLSGANARARAFAVNHQIPGIVGVDMHHPDYLCSCFQWVAPFQSAGDFLAAMREAVLIPGRHPLGYFVQAARAQLALKLGCEIPGKHRESDLPRRGPLPIGTGCPESA